MERRMAMWVFIGILFLVALYLVFQSGSSGTVTQNIGSATSPAANAASSSGMVGGC